MDILVNNAGVRKDANFHEMLEKDWDSVIDTELKGTFNCAQAAQKYMVKQSYGKILNIASPVTAALVSRASQLCSGRCGPGRVYQGAGSGTPTLSISM